MKEEMLIALKTDKDKPVSDHKKIAETLKITEEEVNEMLKVLYFRYKNNSLQRHA